MTWLMLIAAMMIIVIAAVAIAHQDRMVSVTHTHREGAVCSSGCLPEMSR